MPLPRMRLTTLLLWMFVIVLILGLAIQLEVVRRREQAAIARVMASDLSQLHRQLTQVLMDQFLGDRATDILKQSTEVELLRVSKPTNQLLLEVPDFQPTGIPVEDGLAFRIACVLLDRRNYGSMNCKGEAVPRVGLRFRRGNASLHILFEVRPATPGSTHQDVWIKVEDPEGQTVHEAGPNCMGDPELQKMVGILLKR